MNGLLDFFKQGYQNSGLQELGNSIASQPKMYDPHANAQALMGGTPMGQPQGLLNNQTASPVDTAVVNQPNSEFNLTPQQQGQVTYGPQIAPDYNQQPNQEVWGGGGHTPEPAPEVVPYNPAMIQPEVSPWGSAPQQGMVGVESAPPPVATTNPFSFPPGILGEAFDPSMTEEEKLLREAAKAKLPWYLGGTGGK